MYFEQYRGSSRGWLGSWKVLGKLSMPRRPTKIWIIVGQGPIALAVGAGRGCLEFFFRLSFLFSSLFPGAVVVYWITR